MPDEGLFHHQSLHNPSQEAVPVWQVATLGNCYPNGHRTLLHHPVLSATQPTTARHQAQSPPGLAATKPDINRTYTQK